MGNLTTITFLLFFLIGANCFGFNILTTDKSKLATLHGSGFFSLLEKSHSFNNKSHPKFTKFVSVLTQDLKERSEASDIKDFQVEIFDAKWLANESSYFQLSAISIRLDRREFSPEYECGQVRFVYRLKYNSEKYGRAQGLPMTAMLVFPIDSSAIECREYILNKKLLIQKILNGEFTAIALEVNLLSLRILAPYKPDTAGYSEYLLRVFDVKTMEPIELDNTPDENLSKKLKNELLEWITKNSRKIKNAEFLLPKKFLTKKAISVGPAGSARSGNLPFTKLFKEKLDPSIALYLNRSSCQGCHQKGSVSGFHILGEDDSEQDFYNSLKDPVSPNVAVQLEFREKYEINYLKGLVAPKRPLPGRHRHDTQEPVIGGACEKGSWKEHSSNPIFDQIKDKQQALCIGNAMCMPSEIGFPSGYCIGACEEGVPGCHPVPALTKFTECLTSKSRAECMNLATTKVQLKTCKVNADCREDYICAATEGKKIGVCSPPYFLQQLNLNGHN